MGVATTTFLVAAPKLFALSTGGVFVFLRGFDALSDAGFEEMAALGKEDEDGVLLSLGDGDEGFAMGVFVGIRVPAVALGEAWLLPLEMPVVLELVAVGLRRGSRSG